MIVEKAPAKINLYLHVGPVREDGLHELASLFVFAEDGDTLKVAPSEDISLAVEGPFAEGLADLPKEKNLVFKAATLLREFSGVTAGAAITLEKNLPIAAGIGGGSADAAAALRALVNLWSVDITDDDLATLAFNLGADVPACIARSPIHVTGAGEKIERAPALPPLWVCLVNPRIEMPTGPVFSAFDKARPEPAAPEITSLDASSYDALRASLMRARNDLEPFACALMPQVEEVIVALSKTTAALLARMSGSGATSFALFSSASDAEKAETEMKTRGWWAMSSPLCNQ